MTAQPLISAPVRAIRRHPRAALLACTALAAGWLIVLPPTSFPAAAEGIAPAALAGPPSFAPLVNRVKPAVVNISTTEHATLAGGDQSSPFPPDMPLPDMFKHFFDQLQPKGFGNRGTAHALGSGFIIDADGYVLTNNHVVDNADKIQVTLDDGTTLPAKLVGRDAKTDIALLKIDADHALPFVQLGRADAAQIGDWVVAVGNPFGLGGTVTAGIISARGRDLHSGPYDDFIQVDAPINRGNSGGPLFDAAGQVIGMNTAIYSPTGGSVGIGFAIPSNLLAKVSSELRAHGSVERAWLGIRMQTLTQDLARAVGRDHASGALVASVDPNSPAARGGIKQGDVILAFGGHTVDNPRDLARMVGEAHKGEPSTIRLWRGEAEQNVTVTLGEAPSETVAGVAEDNGGSGEHARIGLALAPLTKDARDQLDLPPSTRGVVVSQVSEDSPAADSGLRPGDVITQIGGDAVSSPHEVVRKLHELQHGGRKAVPVMILRNGDSYYIALNLAES
ncbi:MAG: Do family serine endopeptidase [Azospirillum sp.]|nr:Do family serine endopeptidase [Azospirillum sp.]